MALTGTPCWGPWYSVPGWIQANPHDLNADDTSRELYVAHNSDDQGPVKTYIGVKPSVLVLTDLLSCLHEVS